MSMEPSVQWYQTLIKPVWAPPSWIFGPVWSVLYVVIAISFCSVFYRAWRKEIPTSVVWPFVLNLCANFAFTPLQFGLQNNVLALIDICIVLATIVWAMKAVYPHMRWVAFAQIPYLLWVTFATVLQFTITVLNAS